MSVKMWLRTLAGNSCSPPRRCASFSARRRHAMAAHHDRPHGWATLNAPAMQHTAAVRYPPLPGRGFRFPGVLSSPAASRAAVSPPAQPPSGTFRSRRAAPPPAPRRVPDRSARYGAARARRMRYLRHGWVSGAYVAPVTRPGARTAASEAAVHPAWTCRAAWCTGNRPGESGCGQATLRKPCGGMLEVALGAPAGRKAQPGAATAPEESHGVRAGTLSSEDW